jgi:hypothetical protein
MAEYFGRMYKTIKLNGDCLQELPINFRVIKIVAFDKGRKIMSTKGEK